MGKRVEALKEAAKAICPKCAGGVRFDGCHFLGWTGSLPMECPATKIHRLIQAELTAKQWLKHMQGF